MSGERPDGKGSDWLREVAVGGVPAACLTGVIAPGSRRTGYRQDRRTRAPPYGTTPGYRLCKRKKENEYVDYLFT